MRINGLGRMSYSSRHRIPRRPKDGSTCVFEIALEEPSRWPRLGIGFKQLVQSRYPGTYINHASPLYEGLQEGVQSSKSFRLLEGGIRLGSVDSSHSSELLDQFASMLCEDGIRLFADEGSAEEIAAKQHDLLTGQFPLTRLDYGYAYELKRRALETHIAINTLPAGLLSLVSQTRRELFLSVPHTAPKNPGDTVLVHYDAGDCLSNPDGLLKAIANELEMTWQRLHALPFINSIPILHTGHVVPA